MQSEQTHETTKVTVETADAVTDAMLVAGKSDSNIAKFLDQVSLILR